MWPGPRLIDVTPCTHADWYGRHSHSMPLPKAPHRVVRPRIDYPLCGAVEYFGQGQAIFLGYSFDGTLGVWATRAFKTDGDSIGRFAAGHDGPEVRAWCAAGHEWVSGIIIE